MHLLVSDSRPSNSSSSSLCPSIPSRLVMTADHIPVHETAAAVQYLSYAPPPPAPMHHNTPRYLINQQNLRPPAPLLLLQSACWTSTEGPSRLIPQALARSRWVFCGLSGTLGPRPSCNISSTSPSPPPGAHAPHLTPGVFWTVRHLRPPAPLLLLLLQQSACWASTRGP
jgi:hypothetical protein